MGYELQYKNMTKIRLKLNPAIFKVIGISSKSLKHDLQKNLFLLNTPGFQLYSD
jgi:hypothetical protein